MNSTLGQLVPYIDLVPTLADQGTVYSSTILALLCTLKKVVFNLDSTPHSRNIHFALGHQFIFSALVQLV